MKAGSKKNSLIEYIKGSNVPKKAKDLINSDEFIEWQQKRARLESIDAIKSKQMELDEATKSKDVKKIDTLTKEVKALNEKYKFTDAEITTLETELKTLEGSLLDTLKDITFQTFTPKNIRDALKSTKPKKQTSEETQFTLVTKLNVRELDGLSIGKKSSNQLASQFDLQESKQAYTQNPVYTYHRDKTQGPQACVASPESMVAALVRKSANNNKKLPSILEGLPQEFKEIYSNGYLNLEKPISKKGGKLAPLNEAELKTLRKYLEKHIDELNIFPQFLENGSMQVCCAAPNFATSPPEGSEKAKIAKLLVVAQYKAIARLAVLRSRATGEPQPLNLTLVGQGAFNNPPKVMNAAMAAVAKIVKGENVQVYVHAFNDNEILKTKDQLQGVVYNEITANDLKAQDKKLSEKISSENQEIITNWATKINLPEIYTRTKQSSSSAPLPAWGAFLTKRTQATGELQAIINESIHIKTHGQLNAFIKKLEGKIDEQSEILKKELRFSKSTREKTLEVLKESLVSLKKDLSMPETSPLPKKETKRKL